MTRSSNSSKLGARERLQYQEKGYYYPIRVFEPSEAEKFRAAFLDYLAHKKQSLRGLPPRHHSFCPVSDSISAPLDLQDCFTSQGTGRRRVRPGSKHYCLEYAVVSQTARRQHLRFMAPRCDILGTASPSCDHGMDRSIGKLCGKRVHARGA